MPFCKSPVLSCTDSKATVCPLELPPGLSPAQMQALHSASRLPGSRSDSPGSKTVTGLILGCWWCTVHPLRHCPPTLGHPCVHCQLLRAAAWTSPFWGSLGVAYPLLLPFFPVSPASNASAFILSVTDTSPFFPPKALDALWSGGSPTFLAPGTGFVEDNFSTDGGGDGFGMIQAHYMYCALYFYYYYLVKHNEIIIQLTILLTGGGAQAIMWVMASGYKYRWSFPCSPAAHLLPCGLVRNRPRTGIGLWPGDWGPLLWRTPLWSFTLESKALAAGNQGAFSLSWTSWKMELVTSAEKR